MTNGNHTLFGLLNLLAEHRDKNFVQRILQPQNAPKLFDNPGGVLGEPSTHSMAWGEADGKYFVYPTVIEKVPGQLIRLSEDEAFSYALQSGEAIPFNDPNEAAWFSQNYKKVWQNIND